MSITDKEDNDGKWRWFLEPHPEPLLEPPKTRQWKIGYALGDFNAMDWGSEYVSLKLNAPVHVALDVPEDQGYVYGRNEMGEEGWFPIEHVEFVLDGSDQYMDNRSHISTFCDMVHASDGDCGPDNGPQHPPCQRTMDLRFEPTSV